MQSGGCKRCDAGQDAQKSAQRKSIIKVEQVSWQTAGSDCHRPQAASERKGRAEGGHGKTDKQTDRQREAPRLPRAGHLVRFAIQLFACQAAAQQVIFEPYARRARQRPFNSAVELDERETRTGALSMHQTSLSSIFSISGPIKRNETRGSARPAPPRRQL